MLGDALKRLLGTITQATSGPQPEQVEIAGLPVVVFNTRPDIRSEDALARLAAALALIDRYAPWRGRHLRRDLSGILVQRFACRAALFPEERTCLIELTFLVNPAHTAEEVAASLVHEGMHARVAASGARVGPAMKAKEERLCRRAELELGRSLPGETGKAVIARAEASLLLDDEAVAPRVDWDLARRRVAEVDRSAREGR